jgi:DNA invertase Pin-like site-specific DNA recombinase
MCTPDSDRRAIFLTLVASTKGGRLRYVSLTARLAAALREHRHLRGPRVLYQDDGSPLTEGVVQGLRPGFLRLMNAVKPRPRFQVLVMSEESRLGREAIETAYALKQLVTAGVRVFFYFEDRERRLDTPTDKIMLSLTAFADEVERERGRQHAHEGSACARQEDCESDGGGRERGRARSHRLAIDGSSSGT